MIIIWVWFDALSLFSSMNIIKRAADCKLLREKCKKKAKGVTKRTVLELIKDLNLPDINFELRMGGKFI
jgi:hypothetical protein